jgi:hypothetical protein
MQANRSFIPVAFFLGELPEAKGGTFDRSRCLPHWRVPSSLGAGRKGESRPAGACGASARPLGLPWRCASAPEGSRECRAYVNTAVRKSEKGEPAWPWVSDAANGPAPAFSPFH